MTNELSENRALNYTQFLVTFVGKVGATLVVHRVLAVLRGIRFGSGDWGGSIMDDEALSILEREFVPEVGLTIFLLERVVVDGEGRRDGGGPVAVVLDRFVDAPRLGLVDTDCEYNERFMTRLGSAATRSVVSVFMFSPAPLVAFRLGLSWLFSPLKR